MTRDEVRKQKEANDLNTLLWSINEPMCNWAIIDAQREKPDSLFRRADNLTIGIEVTDLLSPDVGQKRAQDLRIGRALERTLLRFLTSIAGSGAEVYGYNSSIPDPIESLAGLERDFYEFLERQKAQLAENGSQTTDVFRHQWGEVLIIERRDIEPGVRFYGHAVAATPGYKSSLTEEDIQRLMLVRVAEKVRKSENYERPDELWLGLLNKSRPVYFVSEAVHSRIESINGHAFDRIILCNAPFDIVDARPGFPTAIDLISRRVYRQ